jgi:alkylated DNA repair dioxygenase AlkB
MAPEGLYYVPDFLSVQEERALLEEIEAYAFHEVRMRGQVARRTVLHFGFDYDYDGWKIHPTTPPPPAIRTLADRAAALARIAPESLEQFLIARYPPGATIGWHRDAPMFGSPVIGVSLGSPCRMRFRRKTPSPAQTTLLPVTTRNPEEPAATERTARPRDNFELYEQLLEPRSLYILDGPARTQWQHSIPPTKALRYSISMRTLRKKRE